MINMRKMRDQYLYPYFGQRILDVGGRGLVKERSYRSLFPDTDYVVADIKDGAGVDVVMPGEYSLPFDNGHFDIVLSGQTLEHVRNPFRLVKEMVRVLKHKGKIVLIAPSDGPRHDSIDCWRFKDDAFQAIAHECNLHVLADYIDTSAPDARSRQWADHVFVGQK